MPYAVTRVAALPRRPLPLERAAVAVGIAAVGRVDRAEAADQPGVDRALRDLVGRIPLRRDIPCR